MDPVLQDRCTEKCAYYVKELISISVKSINVNAAVWKEQANMKNRRYKYERVRMSGSLICTFLRDI